MTWYMTFDSMFWLSMATLFSGSLGLSIKYCLKSKCEDLSLCFGLLKIHRRVDLEVQEEMKEIELGINDDRV
jgi:hypothetical protein